MRLQVCRECHADRLRDDLREILALRYRRPLAEDIRAHEESDDHEPTGSCEECGVNTYDDERLCDKCSWAESR